MAISEVTNEDCMLMMARYPNNFFDWAICDPMYDLETNYLCPGAEVSTTGVKRNHIKTANTLSKLQIVNIDYFNEVKRVSKNQIIWGENYFNYDTKPFGRIIWDKVNDSSTFSNCEIASISSIKGVRIFRYMWNGMLQQDMKNKEVRIHPFQKPVALYQWIIDKFLKPGENILDTHLGSGSNRIAAHDSGIDFYACELGADIFLAQESRFKKHAAQTKLFAPISELVSSKQGILL